MLNEPEIADARGPLEERARRLVLTHGWNAAAYQILNPGISRWFSAKAEAVVGYATWGRFVIVAGAPVAREADLGIVMAEFEEWARAHSHSVCYFGAGQRLEAVASGSERYSIISLGAQPSWHPSEWPEILAAKQSLRAQISRAANKGVTGTIERHSTEEWKAELDKVLREWLDTRGLPALHFLVEPDTLDNLRDRRLIVARREGRIAGFLVLTPVAARNGWLVEQIVRGKNAPNGTAELMLDLAMREAMREGGEYITLGLSPLSEHSAFDWKASPKWMRLVLRWLRAHANRFYNFRGLDSFKAKFRPSQWEEITAVVNEKPFPAAALYAIAAVFGGRSPILVIITALHTAMKIELRKIARALADLIRSRRPPRDSLPSRAHSRQAGRT